MKKQVNQILIMLYALLAMSVTISIFGIVNTLVLSVYERTREIGLLRAIGTSRRQMRRIVRYESVITSVIGGLLGTAVGVAVRLRHHEPFGNQGLVFSVPYGQLVLFLAGGDRRRRARRGAAREEGGQPERAGGGPLRVTDPRRREDRRAAAARAGPGGFRRPAARTSPRS